MPDMTRTREQREANLIDCDLYRLIRRTGAMYDDAADDDRAGWLQAMLALTGARVLVRQHMHPEDRDETQEPDPHA